MKIKGVFLAAILTAVLCFSGNLLAYSGGTGEPNNPYQIAEVNDLLNLTGTTTDYDKCFVLTADINLTGLTFTQTPIATDTSTTAGFQGTQFTGIFDGNSHIISNLTITAGAKEYIGLFGGIGTGGQVKNFGIKNANVTGGSYVGGLVGENSGGILTACFSSSSVNGTGDVGGLVGENFGGTLTGCYASGSVIGTGYVGGLVGYNGGATLTGCYATNSVSGGSYVGGLAGYNYGSLICCYASGSASGNSYVGGLEGYNGGTLTTCYATGSASGTNDVGGLVGLNIYGTLTACYATGLVTGSEESSAGGLIGYDSFGTLTACFWDIQTSDTSTSDGGTGKTTAEMKTLYTFTSAGWDFINVWVIGQNQTYPYLRTQPSADLNDDGVVNLEDFAIFAGQWLEGT